MRARSRWRLCGAGGSLPMVFTMVFTDDSFRLWDRAGCGRARDHLLVVVRTVVM
jgi:hypothetical protein